LGFFYLITQNNPNIGFAQFHPASACLGVEQQTSAEQQRSRPMPALDSRREPLLGSSGHSRNASRHWWSAAAKLCVLPSFVLAYVMASTIERVVFARMAASMHGQVLLMHTALAALNTLLFMVLRLARSQSSRSAVSTKLHPKPQP
jgi:hypothetical protein